MLSLFYQLITRLLQLVGSVQSLLHLANFYAVSSPSLRQSHSLIDKIGLCYLLKHRTSLSHEVIEENPKILLKTERVCQKTNLIFF